MVMYISKGEYYQEQGKKILVNRGMRNAVLGGIFAYLWSMGSRRFMVTKDEREIEALQRLAQMGLVEMKEVEGNDDKYEILTHCILALSFKDSHIKSEGYEKDVYMWIKEAPLNLSIAELVKLKELDIRPSSEWFGKDNLYKLVMKLYDPLSSDRLLEYQMKESEAKDEIVDAVEKLLSQGIIEMM